MRVLFYTWRLAEAVGLATFTPTPLQCPVSASYQLTQSIQRTVLPGEAHCSTARERWKRYNLPLVQTQEEQLADWQAYETANGEVTLDKFNRAFENTNRWPSS